MAPRGVGAAVALLACGLLGASEASGGGGRLEGPLRWTFEHGVASGDPLPEAVVLWTRVTPRPGAAAVAEVQWEVRRAGGAGGWGAAGAAATGLAGAAEPSDYTVKVDATGLEPSTAYEFRFVVGAAVSPVGRFTTPSKPGAPQGVLRLAAFSCSNWGWGTFGSYRAASKMALDAWLHLGDAFYEYGEDNYPDSGQAVRFGSLDPPHELLTLQDYRRRHAFYRKDPDFQALAASAPMIAVWDDHEIANNEWVHGAEDHQPDEGDWETRKRAAVRAYHEWMPTRYFADDGGPAAQRAAYRSFEFGDLATLVMLESRVVNRTDPNERPSAFAQADAIAGGSPPDEWEANGVADQMLALTAEIDAYRARDDKTMLGARQLAWVAETTEASTKRGVTWQLYGQQTVMMEARSPDLEAAVERRRGKPEHALWDEALRNVTAGAAGATRVEYSVMPYEATRRGTVQPVSEAALIEGRGGLAMGRYGVSWNLDGWQGYVAGRERFLDAIGGARNAIVYAGDSHEAWAGVLRHGAGGRAVAAEYDGTGVTSPGAEKNLGSLVPNEMIEEGYLAANPDMRYKRVGPKGFMLFEITPEVHHGEFIEVDHTAPVGSAPPPTCHAAFDVLASSPGDLRPSTCRPGLLSGALGVAGAAPGASAAAAGGDEPESTSHALIGLLAIGLPAVLGGLAYAFWVASKHDGARHYFQRLVSEAGFPDGARRDGGTAAPNDAAL